jgi:uncharacterized protein (TIGR02270 family)
MTVATVHPDNYTSIYHHIYDRFADDAAFLWLLRSIAVEQPHYTYQDLITLDERVDKQLDGLMTAPEESWRICAAALELRQAGEVFTAAVLAFRSLEAHKIQQVVEAGLTCDHACKGLVSALAWLPGRLVHSWIKKFLTSKELNHKYLALAACSARREDPKDFLATILHRDDCIAHKKLYARALRLIGELKRFDLLHALRIALVSDDEDIRFWANWSGILLGDKSLAQNLQPYVLTQNAHRRRAMAVCFRVLPLDESRNWISLLAKDPANIRLVISSTAILGDPDAVNWLIAKMRIPALTRLVGEAFTTITGIDLLEHKLVLEELPDLENLLPENSEQDEDIELNEDEHLPFPDVNKIAAVWQKYQQRFTPAQRYFMGQAVTASTATTEHLHRVFATGHQRQRAMAAMELALLEPAQFLLNHAAKGLEE